MSNQLNYDAYYFARSRFHDNYFGAFNIARINCSTTYVIPLDSRHRLEEKGETKTVRGAVVLRTTEFLESGALVVDVDEYSERVISVIANFINAIKTYSKIL